MAATPPEGPAGARGEAVSERPEDHDDLPDRYRLAGWWTGERLVDRYQRWALADPGRLAVADNSGCLTFGELWGQASALAEDLTYLRPTPGIVLIHLPDTTDWMRTFTAVLMAGGVPATIPITTTADHLRHAIDLVGASTVITCAVHRSTRPAELAAEAARDRAEVITVAAGGVVDRNGVGRLTTTSDASTDLAHVMFTSSTTGPPKAVIHSDDTLATLNRQFAERFGLSDTTPIFMPSPLGHSVGSIHGARLAMWTGAPLILQPDWDPVGALTLVERYGAHFTAAATPFLSDLLDVEWSGERPKLAGLKWFLCGGAQVPPSMVRRARREFPETSVTPLWGMTEGGLTTCLGDESTPTQTEETVGVGLPDLELRVLTDDGTLLPAGAGELAMRGPGVFLGYLGQEDLYREQLTGDGFFRTGDLACIDAEGYVSITGRVKDMIIRGGVNISPVRTENVMASHPAVSSVAVIGWPDERLGERLCAVVSVRDDPPTLEALIAFCADQGLERRVHPERLVLVDDFPRTAAGKIRKRQLLTDLLASEMP